MAAILEMAQSLRECIADMRLTLEAMSPESNDFLHAWGNFRFRWQRLLEISLPLLAPAIAAAALLVFIFDFTSFGVILVLGGPRFATLEVEIYNQTISLFNLPLAAALSLIQVAFTLGLTVAYTRLTEHLSRPLGLRPQGYSHRRISGRRSRLVGRPEHARDRRPAHPAGGDLTGGPRPAGSAGGWDHAGAARLAGEGAGRAERVRDGSRPHPPRLD